MPPPTVLAVLGKGGAGKTAISALLARFLLDAGAGPLLLVDADPAAGLTYAVGATPRGTIGTVKAKLIDAADDGASPDEVAARVDWWVLEALQEFDRFSLLAMGRTESRGCFCPVNKLLRAAITHLGGGFSHVLIDAEAGVEQVQRQVMEQVHVPIVVTDSSRRGMATAVLLAELVREYGIGGGQAGLLVNRADRIPDGVPSGLTVWGSIPQDAVLQRYDEEGRALLELPENSAALTALQHHAKLHLPH
jgi:CO dehydrogenase maturation factor